MKVLLRADGNATIGMGHVMRCLSLGSAVVEAGGTAWLLSNRRDPALVQRAAGLGVQVVEADPVPTGSAADADRTLRQAAELDASWVVADGYDLGSAFQERLVAGGVWLLSLDDRSRAGPHHAHLVLDQSIDASPSHYPDRAARTRLLLGSRYVLLRPAFRGGDFETSSIPPRASRILVTMGGADPVDATSRIADVLAEIDDPELRAVLLMGPANPRRAALAARIQDPRLEVRGPVQAMIPLLEWADLAIAAAGSTTWELCRVGVPTLLVVLADNQEPVARGVAAHGAAVNLGRHDALRAGSLAASIEALRADPEARGSLSAAGRALVDGGGAERVLEAMLEVGGG